MKERWPSPRLVYSAKYNIGFIGAERLHPFDGRKYGRAWALLRRRFGRKLGAVHVRPRGPVGRDELLLVHTTEYLDQLRNPKFVARVLEISALGYLPGWMTDRIILRRMRWATKGTIVAAEAALEDGLAINMGGGYHHASRDDGHGFSAYADVAIAIESLRTIGKLTQDDRIVYIDLDAHQGNGVCRTYFNDRRVFIYDQYNRHIFPLDIKAQRRIDCDVALDGGCQEGDYLAALEKRLPVFLDGVTHGGRVSLAVYNAGSDVFVEDQLGGMYVSAQGIRKRDQFVLHQLMDRRIPTLVVLSGGYSQQSYQLVADLAGYVLEMWA